jgi:hypothetical protein
VSLNVTRVGTLYVSTGFVGAYKVAPNGERRKLANEQAGESQAVEPSSVARLGVFSPKMGFF